MPSTFTPLVDQARGGEFYFDSQAALDGHKAIVSWISALHTMLDESAECAFVEGFPAFMEAEQLAAKFVGLAVGDTGVQVRLTQFIDVATEMAELFRLSIERFATDDGILANYLETLEDPSNQARGTATLGAGYSSKGAK